MGFLRKLALGAGDFGFNLYWQMASFYLLYFYTDVARGLPPADRRRHLHGRPAHGTRWSTH